MALNRLCVGCGTKVRWYHLGRTMMFSQGSQKFWVHSRRCWEIVASIFELKDQELANLYGFRIR